MSKQDVRLLKGAVSAQVGTSFSEEIYKKALAKYKRWMKAAYGGVDWNESDFAGHVGALALYYRETEKTPDGQDTMNRQTFAKGAS